MTTTAVRLANVPVIDHGSDWTEFKKWLNGAYASLQYTWAESDVSYTVIASDPPFFRIVGINKDAGADVTDWETRWKAGSNKVFTPRTSDGKAIVLPSFFPGGVLFYIAGAGDAVDANPPTRGNGPSFTLSLDGTGEGNGTASDTSLEFQFMDWVYLSGGGVMAENGVLGDWMSMKIYAPATLVTSGGGTGNCNVVNGVIVPAAGTGAYNVDLTTAVPVPAFADFSAASGYWEWSEPDTGRGTITASPVPGQGTYHLLTIAVDLARFVSRLPLLNSMHVVIETNIKPKKILPQWKFKVDLHNGGHAGLKTSWYLRSARVKTS